MTQPYHIPALLDETLEALRIRPDGVYVDCTFGGGGHSRAILSRLGERGRLFGFDQDADAEGNKPDDRRFTFVHGNFRHLLNFLRYHLLPNEAAREDNVPKVDGILADLGVSFHHFDTPERGFSFRFDASLDMRMNQQSERTAGTVLNTYPQEKIADILYYYGELRNARSMAQKIVEARRGKSLERVSDLLEVLKPSKNDLPKLFQALRIEVNREMDALEEFLQTAPRLLAPGGVLAILSYHSIEDRMVKNAFREKEAESREGRSLPVFRASKMIAPRKEETEENPRARSAKLRSLCLASNK